MTTFIYLSIGFVLAVVSILTIRKLMPSWEHRFWGLALVIAAAIYVVFALVGDAQDYLFMELGGVVLYGIFAWLAIKYHLLWLAAGWALHIGWDVWLHGSEETAYVPTGYEPMCIGFDIVIAAYIGWVVWQQSVIDREVGLG